MLRDGALRSTALHYFVLFCASLHCAVTVMLRCVALCLVGLR